MDGVVAIHGIVAAPVLVAPSVTVLPLVLEEACFFCIKYPSSVCAPLGLRQGSEFGAPGVVVEAERLHDDSCKGIDFRQQCQETFFEEYSLRQGDSAIRYRLGCAERPVGGPRQPERRKRTRSSHSEDDDDRLIDFSDLVPGEACNRLR